MCHPGTFSSRVRKHLKIIELRFSQKHCAQIYQKKGVKLSDRLMLAVVPIDICNVKNGKDIPEVAIWDCRRVRRPPDTERRIAESLPDGSRSEKIGCARIGLSRRLLGRGMFWGST